MSKKDQTTGLPKKAPVKKPVESAAPAPKPLKERLGMIAVGAGSEAKSRAEREHEISRLILIVTGIALAIVGIIIVLAFVINGVIRPNETVARYNDTNITGAQFQERVRIERAFINERINTALNDFVSQTGIDVNEAAQFVLGQEPFATLWNEIQIADQLGIRVLDDMIDEQMIRAEAAARGISVTQEDIDAKINEFIGYGPEQVAAIGVDPTATPEPTVTPTPFVTATPSPTPDATATPTVEATPTTEATAQATATLQPTPNATEQITRFNSRRETFLNNVRTQSGASDAKIREYLEYQALRDLLADSLNPNTDQVVNADARHILVTTEEEALDIMAALERGESFADLARAKSIDTGSGQEGGELGLNSTLSFVEPFALAIEAAEVGETVGPVESEFGFHIIQVRSKDSREITANERVVVRNRTIENWLDETRVAQVGSYETFGSWIDFNTESPRFVYRQL
jgi:parvulin-like peptidyl-prolyl isomerase